MPSTAPPTADDRSPDGTPATARRRRALGIGPVGLLLATMFSAAVALGFVWLVLGNDDGDPDVVDVQDALDGLDAGPVVPEGAPTAEVGSPAPDVRLDYLAPDGGQETLAQLVERVGTPVVLNFWSSTCAPCLQEMPAFEEVAAADPDAVTVVGVDVQDTQEAGRAMVERTGVGYRNARDPRGEIFAVFGGTALPRTVVIDVDGTVVDQHTGALTAPELTELLQRNGVEVGT